MKCLITMVALTFTLTMLGTSFAQDEPAWGDKKAKAQRPEGERKGQGKSAEKGQGDKEQRGGEQRDGQGGGGNLLFKTLDADGDGTLSAQEIDNALAALIKLDKNKDGQLTSDEFRSQGGQGGQRKGGGQGGQRKGSQGGGKNRDQKQRERE